MTDLLELPTPFGTVKAAGRWVVAAVIFFAGVWYLGTKIDSGLSAAAAPIVALQDEQKRLRDTMSTEHAEMVRGQRDLACILALPANASRADAILWVRNRPTETICDYVALYAGGTSGSGR